MTYLKIIERIKKDLSIVEIISKYVKLTKKNNFFLGICPFHVEKNPSFYVNCEKNYFYCFGCKASGDLISFLMKIKNYDFKKTVYFILESYKSLLKIDEISYKKNKIKFCEEIFFLNKIAFLYFKNNLFSHANALNYLKNRNFSFFLIKNFDIGFLDFDCKKFYDYLLSKNIKEEIIKKSNLFFFSNSKINSFFSNRIIFSIKNLNNEIVAFGGRIIKEGDNPKYLNSKNSYFYQKKDFFFGLEFLKLENSKSANSLYISEGYFDFITLHSLGFKTISTLGGGINLERLKLILSSFENFFFCLDNDAQGRSTFFDSLEFIFSFFEGKIYYVDFFFFKDPFSYFENNSAHLLLFDIRNKKDAFEYFIFYYFKNETINNSLEFVLKKIFCVLKVIFLKNYILYCNYLNFISSVSNLKIYEIEFFFDNFLKNNNSFFIQKKININITINELEIIFCIIKYNKLLKIVLCLKKYIFFSNLDFLNFVNKTIFLYFSKGFIGFDDFYEKIFNDFSSEYIIKKIKDIKHFKNYFTCRKFVLDFFKFKINNFKVLHEKKNSKE